MKGLHCWFPRKGTIIYPQSSKIEILDDAKEESEIMDLLIKAHNKFVSLPNQHPTSTHEWTFYLHGLQHLLNYRTLRRIQRGNILDSNSQKDY